MARLLETCNALGCAAVLGLHGRSAVPAAHGAESPSRSRNGRQRRVEDGDAERRLPKGKWWEIFGDPQLNALEELVDINNQNVKQAEAQFRQARALVAANRANYYPTIGRPRRSPRATRERTAAEVAAPARAFRCR